MYRRLTSRSRGRLSRRLVSAAAQEHSNQERKQRNKKFFHSVERSFIINSRQAASADVN